MTLPDSRMSIVLCVSADVFRRRAESALKTSPQVHCLDTSSSPLLEKLVVTNHPSSTETFFQKGSDRQVYLLIGLQIYVNSWILNAHMKLKIMAQINDPDQRSFRFVLEFDELLFEIIDVIPPNEQAQLNEAIAEKLGPVLASLPISIPLGALLPAAALLTGSVVVRIPNVDMTSDQALSENTLIAGLEVDSDSEVDRDYFLAQFTENPRGDSDWQLSVEKSLLRQLANEVLSEIDFEQDAEDGNGIQNWIETTSTQAYWTGDPIAGELLYYWHEQYVQTHFAEHPIWFKVTGFYDTGQGFAAEAYALGYADLQMDGDGSGDPVVQIAARLFAVGWGLIPVVISDADQPKPRSVCSALLADYLRIADLTFDANCLAFYGVDDHLGLSGLGRIQAPAVISAAYDRGERGRCGNIHSSLTGAVLLPGMDTVQLDFNIENPGQAPLWICQVNLDDPQGVFELVNLPSQPVGIPAGSFLRPGIRYHAPPGDDGEHNAELNLRSNDPGNTWINIPVSGRLSGELGESASDWLLCIGKPGMIPPQEWFDRLSGVILNFEDYTDGDLTPEHAIELAIGGLPIETLASLIDDSGKILTSGRPYPGWWYFTIPSQRAGTIHLAGGRIPENKLLTVQLTTSRMEFLGRFDDPHPPVWLARQGNYLYALFPDRIAVLDVREPRRPLAVARMEAVGASQIETINYDLLVKASHSLLIYDIHDPYSSKLRHIFDLRGGATFQSMQDHLALLSGDGSVRIYSLTGGGAPELRYDLTFDRDARLVPYGRYWALGSERGGLLIDLNARTGNLSRLRSDKMAALLSSVTHPNAWQDERFRVRARPDSVRGGLELCQKHYGELILRRRTIVDRLNRG